MRIQRKITSWLPLTLAALLLAVNVTCAQDDTTPKQRLKSPAKISGFIGGEAHASYVIRARKGQRMTVQISWVRKQNNRAEFTVSDSANFFSGTSVTFGKASDNGQRWSGIVPRIGNYYLYVVAHPVARYTLRVTVS